MKTRFIPSCLSSLVILGILLVSAVVTSVGFSGVTAILVMYGIEEQGGDPGAPGLMFVALLMLCGFLNILTAIVMYSAREDHQKTFSATRSMLLFVVMYVPLHLAGWFSISLPEVLELVFTLLLFASSVALFHAVAQSGIHLYEFFQKS